MLQKALDANTQRNPNAAIQGLQNQDIYRRFGGDDAERELNSNIFAARHSMANRRLDDRKRQHGLTSRLEAERLSDAESGMNIAKFLGLGELGLGFADMRQRKKDLEEEKTQNRAMWDMYAKGNVGNLGVSGLYGLMGKRFGNKNFMANLVNQLRNTQGYIERTNEEEY